MFGFWFSFPVLLFITSVTSLVSPEVQAESKSVKNCFEARKVVVVLKMQRPIYLDENGNYRPKWVNDTYQGKKKYIEDSSRESRLDHALDNLNKLCNKPDDPEEMNRAEISLVRGAKCLAAKADLVLIENPETKSSNQKIRDQKRLVELYCES